MRRIARTVAASVAVILGLALVSVAAVGANTDNPIGRPAVPDDEKVERIPPFNPSPDKRAELEQALNAASFLSEFGERGKHEVQISVSGNPLYAISWRDDPEPQWGTGNFQRSRTVNSGFPVVQVAVNGGDRVVTCRITVDGIEKDEQSTTPERPVVFCEA